MDPLTEEATDLLNDNVKLLRKDVIDIIAE